MNGGAAVKTIHEILETPVADETDVLVCGGGPAGFAAAVAAARTPAPRMRVSQRSRTVMYSLHSLEDCCEVIDQLIANNTVVLTMDELDGHLLQRAVDTLSGAVFALHASIRKASDKTYLVAPMSVEINEAYDMDRRF